MQPRRGRDDPLQPRRSGDTMQHLSGGEMSGSRAHIPPPPPASGLGTDASAASGAGYQLPSGHGGPRAPVPAASATARQPGTGYQLLSGHGGPRAPVPAAAATARQPGAGYQLLSGHGGPRAPVPAAAATARQSGAGYQLPPAHGDGGPRAPDPPAAAAAASHVGYQFLSAHGGPRASVPQSRSYPSADYPGGRLVPGAAQTAPSDPYQFGETLGVESRAASGAGFLFQFCPPAGKNRRPPALVVPAAPTPLDAKSSLDRNGQSLGTVISPKQFQSSSSQIREAISSPDSTSGPSTPSPTSESMFGSKSCRNRNRARSPGRKTCSSESNTARDEMKNFDQQKRLFKSYLHRFYAQLADQMWQEKSFCLRIDYNKFKLEDKTLAYDIANNYEEIKSTLHAATREFFLEKFTAKAINGRFTSVEMLQHNIQRFTKLCFSSMPKSIMSLEDFLKIHKTTTRYLFRAHRRCRYRVALISPVAKDVLRKIVAYVTKHHKAGFAWDGKWKIGDWEVFDGDSVQLRPVPVKLVERCMSENDLEAISTEIIVKLTDSGEAGGLYPAYMFDLCQQLQKTGTTALSDADFMGWFCEFIQYHPALMSSKARTSLLKGLYGLAVRLDYNKDSAYDVIFQDSSFVSGWIKFVHAGRSNIHPIIWKTFWDDNYPDEGTDPESWRQPYKDTAGDLLIMVRHVFVHANRATQTYSDGQLMKHSCEIDLFSADIYKRFLPELLKLIFMNGKMHGEFATEWEFYKSTKEFVYHELPQMPS